MFLLGRINCIFFFRNKEAQQLYWALDFSAQLYIYIYYGDIIAKKVVKNKLKFESRVQREVNGVTET